MNLIPAIRVEEGWLDSPLSIKRAVSSYFENHVSTTSRVRTKLDGVAFNCLSEEENLCLIVLFSSKEIEEVVRCSDGNKSGAGWVQFCFLEEVLGVA
jgi:hypothetical protein